MEFLFQVFDAAADGLFGRGWPRRCATIVLAVVLGIAAHLGVAQRLFALYTDYKAHEVETIVRKAVRDLPATGSTTTAAP